MAASCCGVSRGSTSVSIVPAEISGRVFPMHIPDWINSVMSWLSIGLGGAAVDFGNRAARVLSICVLILLALMISWWFANAYFAS